MAKTDVKVNVRGLEYFRQTRVINCGNIECKNSDPSEPSQCAFKNIVLSDTGKCIYFERK